MSKKKNRPTFLVPRDSIVETLERHRNSNSGRAFTVVFTKRADGSKRTMNCRYGVVSKLKGGTAPFDFKANDLHSVYDMVNHDYRSIALDTLEKVVLDGIQYEIV